MKQYGPDFKIQGEISGWHYAIWKNQDALVLLHPINAEDFFFCMIKSAQNITDLPQMQWYQSIHGTITGCISPEKLLPVWNMQAFPLPQPGEILYRIDYGIVEPVTVKQTVQKKWETRIIYGEPATDWLPVNAYRKTWFLTQADAETALAELFASAVCE